MLTTQDVQGLLNQGGNVLSPDGEKIGAIGQVYVDDDTEEPSWVTVRTGLFGMSETFVPLEGSWTQGNDILVPYTKDQVKDAPRVNVDGDLEPDEEDRLYEHYSLGGIRTFTESLAGTHPGNNSDTAGTAMTDTSELDMDDTAVTAGGDTAEPGAGQATSRQEERPNGGTGRQATGRARLRIYVTKDNIANTVPVTREEVLPGHEPLPEDDHRRPAADVPLHEELPEEYTETGGSGGSPR